LKILKEDQKSEFAQVITGNKLWFYFDYLHQLVWVPSRDEVPEKTNKNWHGKVLNVDYLSVNRIHSLFDMPKGITYNSTFFCDVILLWYYCTWFTWKPIRTQSKTNSERSLGASWQCTSSQFKEI
jgi:hypothetical protein